MDQQKLRSLVFEKTGIKIDANDPAFALVVMNEAILDEAVARHLGVLEQASRALLASPMLRQGGSAAVDDIWENSGENSADQRATSTTASSAASQAAGAMDAADVAALSAAASPPGAATPQPAASATDGLPWSQLIAGALLTAVLVLLGQSLLPRPAATLSEQQQKQLQEAEKWQKVLPRLDDKTRQQVEEALRKL